MTTASHEELAELLDGAERDARAIPHLGDDDLVLSSAGARRVARKVDELRTRRGEEQAGYKLGWTSRAMREALGISQPNFGTLWRYMEAPSSGLDLSTLIHPKAEPEIAFLSGKDLDEGASRQSVLEAAAGWAPAIEVVDTRFASYGFSREENTADNSSSARFSVGEWSLGAGEPEDWSADFLAGGTLVGSGEASAALGSPVEAVLWLVRQLAEEGEVLRAGSIVLTGGLTRPVDLESPTQLEVRARALGRCVLEVTGYLRSR